MTEASIPVDLFNPGQVFACLGLAELSQVLVGGIEAGFDWSDPGEVRFRLRAAKDADPLAAVLQFLGDAEVAALVPAGSELSTDKWGVPSIACRPGDPFPTQKPSTPASLPAVLTASGKRIVLSSWGEARLPDALGTNRDNVKFWAGAAGYPGVGLLRDALNLARPHLGSDGTDPFAVSARQSSSFRFDWRRDYVPIDAGFSLNEHLRMEPRGYPLVEILAVVGLSHARPRRVSKLEYRYAVVGRADPAQEVCRALLPAGLLRAALGVVDLPLPSRIFRMHLDWPGQENQARCITTVLEETAR